MDISFVAVALINKKLEWLPNGNHSFLHKLEFVGVNVKWKVESGKFWNCVAIIKYQLIWLYM